jgi:hypothetical protein
MSDGHPSAESTRSNILCVLSAECSIPRRQKSATFRIPDIEVSGATLQLPYASRTIQSARFWLSSDSISRPYSLPSRNEEGFTLLSSGVLSNRTVHAAYAAYNEAHWCRNAGGTPLGLTAQPLIDLFGRYFPQTRLARPSWFPTAPAHNFAFPDNKCKKKERSVSAFSNIWSRGRSGTRSYQAAWLSRY